MKFLIPLLFPLCLQAQVVSVSYQPLDHGLGVKYDQWFNRTAVYVSASKGNYNLADRVIKDHVKLTAGINRMTKYGYIGAGIIHDRYGERKGEFNERLFCPVSAELNSGVFLGRVVTGMRYDPVKGELTFDIGIRL